MTTIYHHSYEDPDTGEIVDVVEEFDDDDDEEDVDDYRNARRGDSRQTAGRRSTRRRRTFPGPRQRTWPQPYPPRGPRAVQPRPAPVVTRPRPVTIQRDHFTIRKGALLELIPAVGQVWASFLGVPGLPESTGDHITDRNNAAVHRDSLARHNQNQTRILALTELASKAIKAFTA